MYTHPEIKKDDQELDTTLRPRSWNEYIGQEKTKENLRIIMEAAKKRGEPTEHLLVYGGPGLGKTSLAHIIAKEMGAKIKITSGPAVEKGGDLASILTNLSDGDILFIDECLEENSLIALSDGTFKKIKDIKNNEKVVGGKVSKFFQKKVKRTIKITTSFFSLECSENHPCVIMREGRIKTLLAKELKLSDYFLSPLSLPHTAKNNWTPKQASFLALILCDGHISKNLSTIQIETKKDKGYFKKVFEDGLYSFGVTVKSLNEEGRARKLKTTYSAYRTKRETQILRIYSRKLAKKLISLGIPSGNKHDIVEAPKFLFTAPLKTIAAFINTCFCCEGWPIFSKEGKDTRLLLDMNSKIFVQQLQLLLKKFGIHSAFLIRKREKEIYRIGIRGKDLILFNKKIGLALDRKAEILSKICKEARFLPDLIPLPKFIANNKFNFTRIPRPDLEKILALNPNLNTRLNYRYEKIRKIEQVKKQKVVYDFSTTGHTFIANGILTHNCHRLNSIVEEMLYPAMEDFKLDLILGRGPMAKIMELKLPRFTLIGATTRIGLLTSPLRSRFGATFRLDFYGIEDIKKIIQRSGQILNIEIEPKAVELIAQSSRFTPRVANRLLKRVRDFAEVRGKGIITGDIAKKALELLEVDNLGLEPADRRMLEVIIKKFNGGPVGLQALSAAASEEEDTILDIYEPYLMQIGFVERTPKGRVATPRAYKHLKNKFKGNQKPLF